MQYNYLKIKYSKYTFRFALTFRVGRQVGLQVGA